MKGITMPSLPPPTLGVIIGRFQVDTLHRGHRHLIDTALAHCEHVLVVIGSSRALPTARNPLSFEARAYMITKAYPTVIVREHFDQPSNEGWSAALDELIASVAPTDSVLLFGSRDSFIPSYRGRYETTVIDPLPSPSGTDRRTTLINQSGTSRAWRRGVIHATLNRLPHTYSTVDIAVLRPRHVLLAEKKQDRGKLRFIGGFVDPTDLSDEAAAHRELWEETGAIEVGDWNYIGSHRVDDWRYRGTTDSIMTRLFTATYVFGAPIPQDDIDALHWIPRESMRDHLTESHQPLGALLETFLLQHPSL